MFNELPTTMTLNGHKLFLQAAFAPCGHWVVGYVDPELLMVPHNYVAHEDTLEQAAAELQSTLDLSKLVA